MSEWVPLIMFLALFALLFMGIPVSLSMMSIAFVSGWYALGVNAPAHLWATTTDVARNSALIAIPMFILMGFLLAQSGIAEKLFATLQILLRRFPSGTALATVVMCGVFAAATGIVGAVEILVGLMAIPAMMKQKYANSLIAGTICAGGSLGTIIPPTIIVVVYASVAEMSIGDLTAGILLPGVLTLATFAAYIVARGILRPQDAPRPDSSEFDAMPLRTKVKILVQGIVPCTLLIVVVLGSILTGAASATEAAAAGVLGALILTFLHRAFSLKKFIDSSLETVKLSGVILMVVLGGTLFTSTFIIAGGAQAVLDLIHAMDLSKGQMVFMMGVIVFILGYPFDWITIILICVPIFQPIITAMGIDPVWFAVLMIVVMQTSYLTPPVAPSIIYLRSIAPPEITYRDMTRGVLPFVYCQIAVILAVAFYPPLATYLPSLFTKF